MTFSAEQVAMMQAPLDHARIEHRRQAGQQLSYIEAWDAMATANRIWGFDGWSYTLDRLERQGDVWLAVVTVHAGGVTRQDAGVGIPAIPTRKDREGNPLPKEQQPADATPEAHETAIKGAVSDATKRALRSFGNQWGLTLYDKDGEDANVRPGSAQPATARSATTPRPPTPAPAAVRQPTTTPPAATAAKPAPPAAAAKAPSGTVQPDSRALWNVLLDEAAKKGYEKEGMAEWAKQHIQAVFEKQSLADLTAQEWDALIHEVKQAPGAAEAATR